MSVVGGAGGGSGSVIVVGAGVSGLCAALAARAAGARVTVLERATPGESGGNTRFTEAYLRMKNVEEVADDFADSIVEDFQGYPDPSLLGEIHRNYERWPANLKTLSITDPNVVSMFEHEAGPTLRWLTGFGLVFGEIQTQFLTTSTSRIAPRGGGLAIVETLTAAAVQAGVEFVYETTARSLLTDDSGRVVGVVASSTMGTGRYTGAVVLASGGFEGNSEMLARYLGEGALYTRPVCRGGYYNKGEGIQMALDIGAAPCGNYGMFHAEPIDPRSGLAEPSIMVFPYGILVNKHGERFVDEAPGSIDATYERVAREIHHQPDGIGYVILDCGIEDVPNHATAIRTDKPPVQGQTIAELAEKLEVPVETLVSTVAAYNSACSGDTYDPTSPDGLSTRGVRPAKSNWARPIDQAPFVAYPIIAANVFTYGGLRVDSNAQVIDVDGRAIDGLYAAGETVGLYFTHYTGSTSVLKGAVFGRQAGTSAAAARS